MTSSPDTGTRTYTTAREVPRRVWFLSFVILVGIYATYILWGGVVLAGAILGALVAAFSASRVMVFIAAGVFAFMGASTFMVVNMFKFTVVSVLVLIAIAIFSALLASTSEGASRKRNWRLFSLMQGYTIALLIVASITVPPEVLLRENGARVYASELGLIMPFTAETPLGKAPLEGIIPFTGIPEGWTISAEYQVKEPSVLISSQWDTLISTEAVTFPPDRLDPKGNPKFAVKTFLKQKFPHLFIKSVRVTYFTPRLVWD